MKNMKEIKKLRKVTYKKMAKLFREKARNGQSLTGYITFTKDSFDMQYREEARTYVVSSNNKAFMPNMGGYSIYGSAIDGSDRMVRLEGYMRDEKGGEDGWQIEACYVDEPNDHDLINRQMAIESIQCAGKIGKLSCIDILRGLPPSAQPEIIRCKDCKHNPKLEWFGCPMSHLNEKQRPETAWCWKGERKDDE